MEFPSRRERSPLARRIVRAASVAALVLLASCGGGDRVSQFVPGRILAFGDEASAITPAGKRYTVNTLDANSALDCRLNPIWVQYLALSHGIPFAECPGTATTIVSRNYAAAGANVAAVTAQIDTHLAGDSFGGTDLVTVFVGGHDIREQYALYNGANLEALKATLKARGEALAAQINRVAGLGGKVLVVTVPNLGQTAFGVAEETANAGRAAVLLALTNTFNEEMRVPLVNDGRKIGLIDADAIVRNMIAAPAGNGLSNITQPACNVALPDCTTATLVSDANASAWLWADLHQPSVRAHLLIGYTADTRARNNPF